MRIQSFTFGSIRIDGVTYEHDVVIDRGDVRERKKKASKPFRDAFGHTPLSVEEKIPWKCRRLVIGTGARGALPVMDEVRREAERRKDRAAQPPHPQGDRGVEEASQGHERNPACCLLTGGVPHEASAASWLQRAQRPASSGGRSKGSGARGTGRPEKGATLW